MDFDISGAQVFFTIPTNIPILGDLQISETMVVSWIVMAVIAVLCLWLTHDLKVTNISKGQYGRVADAVKIIDPRKE